MPEYGDFANPGVLWPLRILTLLTLLGAMGGFIFVATQISRQVSEAGGDRNWRFLFLCWSDAVAIWILYVAVDFTWIFEELVRMLQFVLVIDGTILGYLTSHYAVLVIRLACYALVMGIAIRLYLRIRWFLESG